MLAKDLSPYQMGGKCGLDGSLRARIGLVRGGVGCCSDYNEAFLLRAQVVGLQARELHNMGHTMAEYYDPAEARWKWIDTSNRVQIADTNGLLVSAYQRRLRLPWRELHFVDLPPVVPAGSDSNSAFSGYFASNNSILYWTKGINLQQQEQFEAPLRQFGVPREVVQAISLSLGIRPGWFVLAAPEAAFMATSVKPTARSFGAMTAWTPAASATRKQAPRLRGSVMPSSTSRNGGSSSVSRTSSR